MKPKNIVESNHHKRPQCFLSGLLNKKEQKTAVQCTISFILNGQVYLKTTVN